MPQVGVRSLRPVLANKAGDPSKLLEIPGHDRQAQTACVTGDQQIVAADYLALSFEVVLDVCGMLGGALIE